MEKLFDPAVTTLEEILDDKTVAVQERRKTAQYVIDQNIGRAPFQIYGQVDLYRQELVLKAFLAGGVDQLPDAERQLLTEYESGQAIPGQQEDVHSELPSDIQPAVPDDPELGQDTD